jgi:hypothetical protein
MNFAKAGKPPVHEPVRYTVKAAGRSLCFANNSLKPAAPSRFAASCRCRQRLNGHQRSISLKPSFSACAQKASTLNSENITEESVSRICQSFDAAAMVGMAAAAKAAEATRRNPRRLMAGADAAWASITGLGLGVLINVSFILFDSFNE